VSFTAGFPQTVLVLVTNVGSVVHTIKIEVVNAQGKVSALNTAVLQPHNTFAVEAGITQTMNPATDFLLFKFTVVDGSRTDIRASAQQVLASPGSKTVGGVLAAE
jgi:hypothetical protein